MNRPAMLGRLRKLVATTTAPSTIDTDLVNYFELRVASAEGQAAPARERSAERSDRIRGRIRAAWGALPLDGEVDAGKVQACVLRMRARGWRADRRTIVSELGVMQTESDVLVSTGYASTQSST